ncbi:ADP-ribosylglycohydrolase family protein [Salmonella enterica]|nr:ADP-ribosylglycohydrolase family protein [Salmonella enterica]EFR2649720.1 ADP-ribosylglycohydrolase family protein [Salmonella enterica]EFS1408069.1 ADP-ribosylglycohydrolase family protein [Salmonella enterica]EHQ8162516.1 ADP-ribosylglycohydrolase family protein [Salmonella enterica]EJZ9218169.1 ADP-ribosylglycohydrolase family protein [Salmonella enterica]
MNNPTLRSAFRGCLLGGAVGDAMGLPEEFTQLAEIIRKYGPQGVTCYQPCYGGVGKFSDDTQMTLFTAEGLLRGYVDEIKHGVARYEQLGATALIRWLKTQGISNPTIKTDNTGLIWCKSLHSRRAPGGTCLSALTAMPYPGAPAKNDSKGCGAVMRMAPVGLFCWVTGRADTFQLANRLGALTHAHDSGYLSGGVLAVLIQKLLGSLDLKAACQEAMGELKRFSGHEETLAAMQAALRLAEKPFSREAIKKLGEGWVGEEALAISVYCALTAQDFRSGIINAINHDGDTDSTGAICGNLLGAMWGQEAIPEEWLEPLELRELVASLGDDLYDCIKWAEALKKYPAL